MTREKIAAQAAVIEQLRDALLITANKCQYLGAEKWDIVAKALVIPTDSKRVLQEWLDSVLGEPIGYADSHGNLLDIATKKFGKGVRTSWYSIPLFKKPEKL